jgi:hypothetical protein
MQRYGKHYQRLPTMSQPSNQDSSQGERKLKIKLYPKGYSPRIAMGTPGKDLIRMGINWTKEETQKHKEMEDKAIVLEVETPPIGQWHERL